MGEERGSVSGLQGARMYLCRGDGHEHDKRVGTLHHPAPRETHVSAATSPRRLGLETSPVLTLYVKNMAFVRPTMARSGFLVLTLKHVMVCEDGRLLTLLIVTMLAEQPCVGTLFSIGDETMSFWAKTTWSTLETLSKHRATKACLASVFPLATCGRRGEGGGAARHSAGVGRGAR